jgi:UDP-3-O-[3-hydroxymyristoyl] glucosamine N-acyltransferase
MKLSELAEILAARGCPNQLEGEPDMPIHGVNTLSDAAEGDISFMSNPRYTAQLVKTGASAVIVPEQVELPSGLSALRCRSPYNAMATATIVIYGYRKHPQWGMEPRTGIADSARIGPDANIGPFVTISEDVSIGANATIYPGCYIGDRVSIGDDVILYPNVVIYNDSRIGDRVTLHAGTVVGEDGVGYAPVEDSWLKIPQIGRVVIEDDVEIGACCNLERATLGETRIGSGTKFGDQVLIGHGCKIGRNCMFVGQSGLAGSVTVGDRVTMGGQVAVAGHLSIGDNTVIHGKSGVWSSIDSNMTVNGNPAIETNRYRRQAATARKLPEMRKQLLRLEQEVARLRQRLDNNE